MFGHTFEAFLDSGTSAWGRRTAEWFIIYLFTEAAVTPHNIRHGCNAVSFLQGFAAISKELVSRIPLPRSPSSQVKAPEPCPLYQVRPLN